MITDVICEKFVPGYGRSNFHKLFYFTCQTKVILETDIKSINYFEKPIFDRQCSMWSVSSKRTDYICHGACILPWEIKNSNITKLLYYLHATLRNVKGYRETKQQLQTRWWEQSWLRRKQCFEQTLEGHKKINYLHVLEEVLL
jgi:hypothetical protein